MTTQKNDEIDLLDLLIRFLKFFKKNFWLLTILFFIGSILGFIKVKISKPYYETTITATCSADINLTIDIINSLYEKIKNEESTIEEFDSLNIKNLEAEKKEERINIIIEYENQSNLASIKDALLNYLNENQFINRDIELRKKQYTELISKIENEIIELDSLQNISLRNQLNNAQESIVINEKSDSHQRLIQLYDKKYNIERSLIKEGFHIIDYSATLKITNLLKSIIIFAFGFAFIGFSFLVIKKINQKYLL